MPTPIAIRFGDSAAQKEAHERLQDLLKQAEGQNGIKGMGTLIREIVIKYLPLAEQELVPFTSSAPVASKVANRPITTDSENLTLQMPDDWD